LLAGDRLHPVTNRITGDLYHQNSDLRRASHSCVALRSTTSREPVAEADYPGSSRLRPQTGVPLGLPCDLPYPMTIPTGLRLARVERVSSLTMLTVPWSPEGLSNVRDMARLDTPPCEFRSTQLRSRGDAFPSRQNEIPVFDRIILVSAPTGIGHQITELTCSIGAQERPSRDQIREFRGFPRSTGIFPPETGSISTASATGCYREVHGHSTKACARNVVDGAAEMLNRRQPTRTTPHA
jgi:hypothetical protein